MIEIGNSLDGTVEKAISATEKLNGLPKFIQKFALAGDFSLGNAKRIDLTSYTLDSKELKNYIALVSTLDKKQRDLILSMTSFGKNINQSDLSQLFKQLSDGTFLNGFVVEQVLKENDFSKAAVEGLTAVEGLKDATTGYGLALTTKAIPAMEQWINQNVTSVDITKLQQDNIITGTAGNYKFSDSFVKVIKEKQKDIEVTKELINEQQVWNGLLQIGKQLLVSFAISAFIAGIQKLIQAWKDYRDRFVNGMNDAHSAAEEAKADVEEIQSKINELKQKVKDAGADQISDIVDPAERAKLEAINTNLERQLELKKQLQEKEEKEEHTNAVGVYNTKNETVYKDADGNYDYTMGMAPDTSGYKATGTEALGYYSEMLDEYTEKYNKLLETTTDENDPKLRLVKEQMDYAADEVSRLSNSLVELQGHLNENSDEYNNITNVLGTATDALSYYNGDIDVSNSKLTELTDKIKELDSASKSYYDTVTTNQKYQKYGNIDNTNRGVIRWNKENLQKYSQFAKENGVTEGSYSTVLGSANEFDKVGEIAYTPMLQTENGVVPLTSSEIEKYINDVIQKASTMDGGATPENILKVDAEGITETVAGEATKVQGMIAAVEGQIKDGAALTAADVAAISGHSTQELQNEFGEVSKYVGYSMHDIQASVEEMGDGTAGAIARIQQQIPNLNKNILSQMLMTEGTGFTEETQKSFEVLYEQMNSLGLDVNAENCKLFATALEKLGYIADTTADQLAKVAENKDKLEEATTGLKNIQSAYGTLSDVVDEYNKNGYLTVSTLTSLIDLGPEYYDCLVDESGQLAINTENINTMADAYYEMAKAALYAQAIESLDANTNTYANASKFLATAEKQVTDMKSLLYAHGQELIDKGGLTGDALATQVKAQQKVINTYSAMIDLLDKTHSQSTENQFRNPKDNSSSKSSKNNTTDPVSAWKTMTTAMEEYNKQGALCVSTLTDLMGLEDEYTSLLNIQDNQMSIDATSFKNLMLAEIAQANALDDSGKSAEEFKKILEWVDANVKGETISYYELVAAIEGYSAALDKAKAKTDAFKDAWDNGKTVKETLEKSRTGALDYEGTEAQSSALQTIKEYSAYDPKLMEKAYNQETGKIDLSGDVLKDAVTKSLEEQAEAARSEGGDAAEAIAKSYEMSAKNIREDVISVQDYFDGLGSTIDEVNTKIDDIQSAFTDLDDVTDEYNAYGGLSVDSMQKLLTMQPEYLACLQMNGGQLEFNRDKMVELLIAQLESRKEFLASKEETKAQVEIIQQMIDTLRKNGVNAIAGMTYEANKLQTIFSNIKDLFSSLLDLYNKANEKQSNALKLRGEAWVEEIDKRIDAINEENDAQEKALELTKLRDEYEKARTNKTVRVYTANGYEWQSNTSDVREAQNNLNDKIRENTKQEEIDKLNELKDKIQEINNLIGTSLDDYNAKQAYAAEFTNMTIDQMEANMGDFKDAVLANMQAIQGATNMSNVITNLTSLIETLIKLNDTLNMIKTGTTQSGGLAGLINNIKNMFFGGGTSTDGTTSKGFLGRIVDGFKSIFSGKSSDSSGGGLLSRIWNGGKKIFSSIFGGGSKSGGAGGGLFSTITNAFSSFFSGSGGNGIIGMVTGFFKTLGGKAAAAISGTGGLTSVLSAALSNIPVIGPLLLGIGGGLGLLGGGNIFTGIKKVGSAVGKVVKSVGSGITKVAKSIGGWKIWPWNWGKKKKSSSSSSSTTTDTSSAGQVGTTIDTSELTEEQKAVLMEKAKKMVKKISEKLFKKNKLSDDSRTSLVNQAQQRANSELNAMKTKFNDTWKSMASQLGLSESTIDEASETIFGRMQERINDTMSSMSSNTELTSDEMQAILKDLFAQMGLIYENGCDNLTSISTDMTDELQKRVKDTCNSVTSDCKTAVDELNKTVEAAKPKEEEKKAETTQTSSGGDGGSSSSSSVVTGDGKSLIAWWNEDFVPGAKEDYNKAKNKVTKAYHDAGDWVDRKTGYSSDGNNSKAQEIAHAVSHPVETLKEAGEKIKESAGSLKDKLLGKKASGSRRINQSGRYNIDERGSELLVRQPQAGRYTYLETGDGVVPADITSKLFEMGGNPDKWFTEQLAKNQFTVNTQSAAGSQSINIGDIIIQKPIGDADSLAREINNSLPNLMAQTIGKQR